MSDTITLATFSFTLQGMHGDIQGTGGVPCMITISLGFYFKALHVHTGLVSYLSVSDNEYSVVCRHHGSNISRLDLERTQT